MLFAQQRLARLSVAGQRLPTHEAWLLLDQQRLARLSVAGQLPPTARGLAASRPAAPRSAVNSWNMIKPAEATSGSLEVGLVTTG